MRIGILTFHRPINYGAYLQAFSLSNKLKECLPGAEVEIIDYISPKERRNIYINLLRDIKHGGIIGGIRGVKKKQAFSKSYSKLRLSKKRLCTNNLEKLYQTIEENYDCLIIGSDAIFNWNQTGFPTPFIPDRRLSIPVMTYAASVHGMKFYDVSDDKIQKCKEAFQQFALIGTRDSCTEEFVKYCDPACQPTHCCDPTVFIDTKELRLIAGNYKQRIQRKYGISLDDKYIVIMSPDSALTNEITRCYGKDYTIIHVFEGAKNDRHFLYDLTPFEWAEVLAHASVVITRFFHGTLLSLVHGTPAIVIDYSKYNGQYESKLKDLMLTRFNLPELYYDMEYADGFDMNRESTFQILFERALKGEYKDRILNAISLEKNSLEIFLGEIYSVANGSSEV